ncbi:hypothetical protein OG792_08135 [Micromonospora sp. NBC_01699]|uniref:hypothetical protein n=1 Tax=Micromonospora sp. NBC_01699 TaxID=2975984 RepID=UPI002E339A65|nr:hypothetical protein [Micromonospora sp. NBC_01699]
MSDKPAVTGEHAMTDGPAAPVPRSLAVFALAYGLLHHLGGALGGLGTVGPTRWADWAELLVPYAVLVPAAVALAAGGAGRTVWAVYLAGALAYAEGKGVHVAANSIANVAPGSAAHLWDEIVGHYVWYAGTALVLAALAVTFARSDPPRGIGGYLLALLVGLTHATNSLEGGTAVFGLVVAIVACGWGWATRARLGRLLLVGYAPAVPLLLGYGLWHGGFPQPSELG